MHEVPGVPRHTPVARGRKAGVVPRPTRYKLSAGGRARSVPDVVELLVARTIGRDLTPIQGWIVQVLAVAIFAGLVYAFFVSGLFMRVVEPIAQWYASQVFPTPTAAP
jgi:hypothetical protein